MPVSTTAKVSGKDKQQASVPASAPLSWVFRNAENYGVPMKVADDTTGEQIGTIYAGDIIKAAAKLFPAVDESCEITLQCPRHDYSASIIARAVEDCNAHLLNLNVIEEKGPDDRLTVLLRIDHLTGDAVARSLERYGYFVTEVAGSDERMSETTRERINELMHYLDV